MHQNKSSFSKNMVKKIDIFCLSSLSVFPFMFLWLTHPFLSCRRLDRALVSLLMSVDLIGIGFSTWWGLFRAYQKPIGRLIINAIFNDKEGKPNLIKGTFIMAFVSLLTLLLVFFFA